MKPGVLLSVIIILTHIAARGQTVKHEYRFFDDFKVAAPACSQDLVPVIAAGNCPFNGSSGSFVTDVLPCENSRTVYHTNRHSGLQYQNAEGAITENYTIQMYVKSTDWGDRKWARIIDFSNGQLDQGIYFSQIAGSSERCIDFYPSGIAGDCPYFKLNEYYLLTFTRNGQTGVMDVYVGNKLFVSYNDSGKRYVGKTGVPIFIYRDDTIVSCESGAANFAYLSFSNTFSTQADVDKSYSTVCYSVNINPSAEFSISPNPICGSDEVTINYTGALPSETGYSFKWEFDGATIISGNGKGPYVVKWNSGGSKSVTLTVTNDACNNDIVNTKNIPVAYVKPGIAINEEGCGGEATLTVKATEGQAPFQYSLDGTNYQADSIFQIKSGTYKVFLKDANNCRNDTTFTVTLKDLAAVRTLPDTAICAGQQIRLSTTGNAGTYSWSPAAGLDDPGAQEPVASPTSATTYIVTLTQDNCSYKDTVTIDVLPELALSITPDAVVRPGVPYPIEVSIPGMAGAPGITYAWSPPTGLDHPNIANPRATIVATQTFIVSVGTPEGCTGMDSVTLSIPPAATVYVPDVFTPDGDGKNEVLLPVTNGIDALRYFNVYNRWGEVIYHTRELTKGWDGRVKGVLLPAGTYVWSIEAVTTEGDAVHKSGSVLLIR
ncbi:hypothetical protein DYBT9275_02170 [Dyadobacter sp. CECT 9275]|uniref:Gliding motility-associated C-terminal domain-containing protein n=1 Tax=Dyadobacter helix TaxID=2822344 RepID=A0A916JBM7_9BACT|nr:gliding motility-associated C-terminal domain-containing protein [Dyadobacter sp. CECT 9275]CAG4999174.1 hypothetical protein DYBT9275_02170 [Dyadobacter sp. CECT 9275]